MLVRRVQATAHIRPIILDEFLRKVVNHAFDAAAEALIAAQLSRAKLAADLMALALRAWARGISMRSIIRGEGSETYRHALWRFWEAEAGPSDSPAGETRGRRERKSALVECHP